MRSKLSVPQSLQIRAGLADQIREGLPGEPESAAGMRQKEGLLEKAPHRPRSFDRRTLIIPTCRLLANGFEAQNEVLHGNYESFP